MNLRRFLLTGSILALPVAAAADPVSGLYVGAGAGANFLQNEPSRGFGLPGGGTAFSHQGVRSDTGWLGLASVGYGFGNGLRAEIEGDYRRNRLDGMQGAPGGGFENKYGAMVNLLYDIDVTQYGLPSFGLVPYIGVGAGWQQASLSGFHAGGAPAELMVNKAVNEFAFQGIVGLAFPIDQVPGLALTAEYRLMDLPESRRYGAVLATPAGGVPGRLKLGDDINHSVLLGVRYAMFTAPPPPPPAPAPVAAPAPAPSRTYLVFFDWDKADLTDRARQIIGEAAQNSTRVQLTRIECNGYTDTSGTPAYNQKLSLRRAQNVAAELVRDGVPQNAITIQGFGDTHLLVPTGQGVREPQNRRVEIILK
jgi:hypothetical protein